MKTTADFLDDLRARHGLTSDNKLALHMGWQRAQLGRYRAKRETFSDQTALKVAAQLGIEPAYVMACMQGQRARTPETRSAWERIAAKVAAAVLIAAFDISLLFGQGAGSAQAGTFYTYPPIPRRRRERGAFAWIRVALGLSRIGRVLALAAMLAAPSASWAGDWGVGNTIAEAGFLALLAADAHQTGQIADHPGMHENNPVLGEHPSNAQVRNYFLAAGVAHVGIALALPPKPRAWFQGVSIGVEAFQVDANHRRFSLTISIPL